MGKGQKGGAQNYRGLSIHARGSGRQSQRGRRDKQWCVTHGDIKGLRGLLEYKNRKRLKFRTGTANLKKFSESLGNLQLVVSVAF